MAAQVALTHLVWVQILAPPPIRQLTANVHTSAIYFVREIEDSQVA